MSDLNFIIRFRSQEAQPDVSKANWYTVGAVALAAASAGADIGKLYSVATEGLSLDDEKTVQRRLKEAILKTSPLYGIPRSLQALLPLFAMLQEEAIDDYGPRFESLGSTEAENLRVQRGRKYFDTLWTPEAAQATRDFLFKYQPDLYLLNQKMAYEWVFSEDTILSPIETQMCAAAALICSKSPVQAMWHTRGIVRHGGTLEQARFAQELALAVAEVYKCGTEDIISVDEIDFEDTKPL